MKTLLASILMISACGGGGGGSGGADAAKVFMDAPVVAAQTIKISGTATADGQSSSTPLGGVVVAFYKASDETTPLGMMTTGSDGTYSFTIATGGTAVDGFIEATLASYVDNYLYATAAIDADYTADVNMVTSTNFSLLGDLSGQSTSSGLIIANVEDASGSAVTGATITSTPASTYKYTASGGVPTGTTATGSDGVGYFINVPVGAVTINATKAGITFKPTTLKSHAGALTTTNITP